MKRIITIIVSVLVMTVFAIPASAQLNITSEQIKVEKVGTLRSTYASLYVEGTTYFLTIRSSNQFDDAFLFYLGDTAEESILTLKDLCSLCETMDTNAAINVEDAKGQKALLIKKTMLGKPYLDITMDVRAGKCNMTLPEFQKAIEMIDARASE